MDQPRGKRRTRRSLISIAATVALLCAAPDTSQARNLYVLNTESGTVGEYNATTGATVSASFITGLIEPFSIALLGNNIYTTNNITFAVEEYDATTGALINDSFIAASHPHGLAISGSTLYVTDYDSGAVSEYNAMTGATINASLNTGLEQAESLAVSGSNLFVAGLSSTVSGYVVGEYNAVTGATINASLMTGFGSVTPSLAVSGSALYVGYYGGVGEYNATTGATINASLISRLDGDSESLVISGNSLYVAISGGGDASDQIVGEYNATTGATINASLIIGVLGNGIAISPPPPLISSTLSVTGTADFPFNYQIKASNSPASYGSTDLPKGLRVSASTGLISGTPTASGTFAATISAINLGGTGSKTLTLTILPSPPEITSGLMVSGTDGFPFDYQIEGSNHPTKFGATGFPRGLTVDKSTGLISGVPTVTGTFPVTISATNGEGTGSKTLVLTILPPPPKITSGLTASGTSGLPFEYQIKASYKPTGFKAAGLPKGLSTNKISGLISGIPTVSGTFPVTLSASNAGGTGMALLSLAVVNPPAPVITSALTATGTDGFAFEYTIKGTHNPTSFKATGLPQDLGYDASTGLISGKPAVTGKFDVTISASNAGGTGSRTLTLTILPAPPKITSGLTASGTAGSEFSYQIKASGNPVSFDATGLPPGLGVDKMTGLISGKPAGGGLFAVTIGATNAGGTGSAVLALTFKVSFPGLQGSYNGLGAVDGTNAALFAVSLDPKGDFTGKLTAAGASYPLSGTFSIYGTYSHIVVVGADTLTVKLALDAVPRGISGTIAATTAAGTTSYSVESGLLGVFKASTLPAGIAGRYTAIFPALSGAEPTLPHAPGYGTMTVTATGAVSLTGKLGDGTALSVAGQLHADRKTWTLFAALYAGTHPGTIAGTMTFEALADGNCAGTLDWIKPAQAAGSYYRDGFAVSVDLMGAKYAAPPLAPGAATFTLGGGSLPASAITDSLTITSKDIVTVKGVNHGGITVTLTPSTGAFTGIFHYPVTDKKTPFGGVIYKRPAPAGYGSFLGTDQSGALEITQ